MVVWPGLVIRHAIAPLREGNRRGLRVGYIAVAVALIVYFFASYLRDPTVCNKPIWAVGAGHPPYAARSAAMARPRRRLRKSAA